MGWLSAIGAGGGQAVDRYSQWRQLDQENQWKAAEEQRRQQQAEQNRLDAELQRKATQLAVTKGELGNITDRLAPGAAVDEPTIAELNRLGAGHLVNPTSRTFRGTFEQQQNAAKAKRDEELYGLQKSEYENKLAEMTRVRQAQANLDAWMKANPKAGTREKLQAAAQFGVSELPVGLKEDLDYERALRVAGINSQAEMARLNWARRNQADEDKKAKLAALREELKGLPASLQELYMQSAAKALAAGESPTNELKAGALMQWGAVAPRRAALEQELGLPRTGGQPMAGSAYYQNLTQQLPALAAEYVQKGADPAELFKRINDNPGLQGPEKWALRQQAREMFQTFGIATPPPFEGNEQQAAPGGGPVEVSPDQMMPQVRFGGGMPSRSAGLQPAHAPSPLLNAIVPSHSRR